MSCGGSETKREERGEFGGTLKRRKIILDTKIDERNLRGMVQK